MDTKLDDIEGRIIDILNHIALDDVQEGLPSDRDWTTKLNQRIGALGAELGHYICGRGSKGPSGQGEWLYDLVWLEFREGGTGTIDRVPLVLESEWNTHREEIVEDFQSFFSRVLSTG